MLRFEAPIGPEDERNAGTIWPAEWIDQNPYGSPYEVKPGKPAIHTGADFNRKQGVDNNAPVFAMGDGTVTFSGLFSDTAWGNLIVIYHGVVDGKQLYSRYGHVQGIESSVVKDAKVHKGQLIARVGNGGPGLNFDPHLHFDISTTSVLDGNPGFWPGNHKDVVEEHFVDPFAWLLTHIQDDLAKPPAPVVDSNIELRFAMQPEGVQIRTNHSLSAEVRHQIQKGAQLSLMKGSAFREDDLIWGQVSGGDFDGCWAPVCKEDKSVFYLSKQAPA